MLTNEILKPLILDELKRDRVLNDITTRLVLPKPCPETKAVIIAKEDGIFCGEAVIRTLAEICQGELLLTELKEDGAWLESEQPASILEGNPATLLAVERTLLNFISHLSGVASATHRFVRAVDGLNTKILSTRKTLPGLRDLQHYAVRVGGGYPHRGTLSDSILIKDNHLHFTTEEEASRKARAACSASQRLEIEAQSLESLDQILKNPPDVVMLDNLSIQDLKTAIKKIGHRSEIEVSGGVTLENVRKIAELGVNYISVGRLTHSAPALNFSLEFVA